MKKKLLSLTVGLFLVSSLVLTGCGGQSAEAEDPLADGVLSFGVEDTYVPLEFRNDQNETVGFDIDLGNAIAKKLGVESQWVSTSWDGIFNGLNAKQYDAVLSGTSITPERKEGFSMSDPYITNGIVIVSGKSSKAATTEKDLAGKKVGVQIETTSDYAAEAMKKNSGVDFEVSKFDSMLDAFAALEGQSIDYIVVDQPVGAFYTALKPEAYKITSEVLSNEPIGITMRKGDTAFTEKINATIEELKADGTMAELSVKWFGSDITKNISEELKTIE